MEKENVPASFFFTGEFCRTHADIVKRAIKSKRNYVGPHSDNHLLLADWTKIDSTLVTRDSLYCDMQRNYRELERLGANTSEPRFFLPPYEWINDEVSKWIADDLGLQLINLTPGIYTCYDYALPGDPLFRPTEELINQLMEVEATKGLQNCMMLIHAGTESGRVDKLYNHFGDIVKTLKEKGYEITTVDKLITLPYIKEDE